MTVRIGLIGTGHWAENVHAPSLAAVEGAELAGVWGRNAAERERIAAHFGVTPFDSPAALAAAVDVVDFAVAPAAQAGLALEAARAGRDLLLEKPVALDGHQVSAIADALDATGSKAVVFMTRLFDETRASWLSAQLDRGWTGAHAEWISTALSPGSPYATSAWRHGTGLVWDLLPHIFSQVLPVLGPVEALRLDGVSEAGVVEVTLRHAGGAGSDVRLTATADPAETAEWVEFRNAEDTARSPQVAIDYVKAHGNAVRTLLTADSLADDALLGPATVRASVAMTDVMKTVETALSAPETATGRWMELGEGWDDTPRAR